MLTGNIKLISAFTSFLQLFSISRCVFLSVPGPQPAVDAFQVLPPSVTLRIQESTRTARSGGEMGSARELLVLLLMRTRTGVAFGAPSQEPAIAGLEVANYCVSNHRICFFVSPCQKAVGMFKVKLWGCSRWSCADCCVLAKHNPKNKIRTFLFLE